MEVADIAAIDPATIVAAGGILLDKGESLYEGGKELYEYFAGGGDRKQPTKADNDRSLPILTPQGKIVFGNVHYLRASWGWVMDAYALLPDIASARAYLAAKDMGPTEEGVKPPVNEAWLKARWVKTRKGWANLLGLAATREKALREIMGAAEIPSEGDRGGFIPPSTEGQKMNPMVWLVIGVAILFLLRGR